MAASQLGVLAPHASPLLREDYARRAGAAAAYREAAGITDPGQAIAPTPPRQPRTRPPAPGRDPRPGNTRRHRDLRRMNHGELEARILDGDRAQASAARRLPRTTAHRPSRSRRLAAIRRRRSRARPGRAANATALASRMAAQASSSKPRTPATRNGPPTASTREIAGKAKAELQRRGQQTAAEEHRDRRAWRPGGGSSKPTSTPWTAPSSASTRRPSMTASHGRRNRSRKPGIRDRTLLHPDATRSPSSPGHQQPGHRQIPSQTHPSRKPRPPRPPNLGLLTRAAPPGWMSCRPARIRPRAGSTRSGQNLTPAGSTPRGSSGRPRPNRRPPAGGNLL